jgi:predicted nuclease of predicted toxin-antitoxin system
MRLYLDDDSVDELLVRLLRKAGLDVLLPASLGIVGSHDARQFMYAIRENRVLLTHKHKDFPFLHELILEAQGHHHGLLLVRRDNDPRRDLTLARVVRTIANLLAAGAPIPDNLHILNHWR